MNEFLPLIIEHEGEALTTSRAVAENFGKRHDNIIRDIEQIFEDGNTLKNGVSHLNFEAAENEVSQSKIGAADVPDSGLNFEPVKTAQSGGTVEEFLAANFRLSEYTDAQGKPRKQYIITKDGFALLAMGFTGAKALQFKVAYINAFNRMEQLIHGQGAMFPDTRAGAVQQLTGGSISEVYDREAGVFMDALIEALTSGRRSLVDRNTPLGEEPAGTIGEYSDVLVRVNFLEALNLYRERSAAPISRAAIKSALVDTGRAALLRSKKNVLTIRGRRVCALEFVRAKNAALDAAINDR